MIQAEWITDKINKQALIQDLSTYSFVERIKDGVVAHVNGMILLTFAGEVN